MRPRKPAPPQKALRELRRRLGIAPVKALFGVLAGPLGRPRTPGVMFGRYRTVACDGCKSVKVPDTERNRGWLGKMKASLGETGYPVIQPMTLCETGTRALLGAVTARQTSVMSSMPTRPASPETDRWRKWPRLMSMAIPRIDSPLLGGQAPNSPVRVAADIHSRRRWSPGTGRF